MPTTDSAEPIMKRRAMNGASDAYVRIDGRFHSLGRWGSPSSLQKFDRLIAEWRVTMPPTREPLNGCWSPDNSLRRSLNRKQNGEIQSR